GDRNDPGPEWDLLGTQPERIPMAREPLVMVEDDRDCVLERRGLLEDTLADPRMLDDRPPLGRGQRGRLLEDVLGYRHLADVMEEGCDAKPGDVRLRQLELAGASHDDRRDEGRWLAAVVRQRGEDARQRGRGRSSGLLTDLDGSGSTGRGNRGAWDAGVVVGLGEDVRLVPPERLRRIHRGIGVPDEGLHPELLACSAG